MPTYTWKCACGLRTDLKNRSYSQSQEPPSVSCPICGVSKWKRVISAPSLVLDEDHKSIYPFKADNIQKVALRNKDGRQLRYRDGKPAVVSRDVVFNNKREHVEYMKRNGLVQYGAGDSPSVGKSQHSWRDIEGAGTPLSMEPAEHLYLSEQELLELSQSSTTKVGGVNVPAAAVLEGNV